MNWNEIIDRLQSEGDVKFSPGLTAAECKAAEEAYGFVFPDDLKEFLMAALPEGKQFPNWRDTDSEHIRWRFDTPIDGILFDVERNHIWLENWGAPPDTVEEAKKVVTQLVADAPTLIPIYAHRMMPETPHEAGNPVYSVHQTDIICYGVDLSDYLAQEFLRPKAKIPEKRETPQRKARVIDFWDVEHFQTRWTASRVRFVDQE